MEPNREFSKQEVLMDKVRKTSPKLRALVALLEDLNSPPSTHTKLTVTYNSRSRVSEALFWLQEHIQAHTCTH